MVSSENLYYLWASGAVRGDVFKEKIILDHLLSQSLFSIGTPPLPRINKLLEGKTKNDVVRIGLGVVNAVQSQGKCISKILSLIIEISRSTMAMNCKITIASEQFDHHST